MQSINICEFSGILSAYQSCKKSGNTFYEVIYEDRLNAIIDLLPHGSGIDSGMKFLWDESNGQKLVFSCDFHHMDENGYYDGWSEHKVIITPSFPFGFDIRVTGRDRNGIKEYLASLIHDSFHFDREYQMKKETV